MQMNDNRDSRACRTNVNRTVRLEEFMSTVAIPLAISLAVRRRRRTRRRTVFLRLHSKNKPDYYRAQKPIGRQRWFTALAHRRCLYNYTDPGGSEWRFLKLIIAFPPPPPEFYAVRL